MVKWLGIKLKSVTKRAKKIKRDKFLCVRPCCNENARVLLTPAIKGNVNIFYDLYSLYKKQGNEKGEWAIGFCSKECMKAELLNALFSIVITPEQYEKYLKEE